jgi:hypothetical protein
LERICSAKIKKLGQGCNSKCQPGEQILINNNEQYMFMLALQPVKISNPCGIYGIKLATYQHKLYLNVSTAR